MGDAFNIYCDESCHLENDGLKVMALGAIWTPRSRTRSVTVNLRRLKVRHGLPATFEMKWSKVSPAKVEFYRSVVEHFFDDPALHFRGLIVPDKSKLKHEAHGQDHDLFFHKMYYYLIGFLLDPKGEYRIFLDIKDTHSGKKLKDLHKVLCNKMYDFNHDIIRSVMPVHSHDMELVQLTDILLGALSYVNRGLTSSPAKNAVVDRIRSRSGYDMLRTTLIKEEKFNIFRWQPQ